MRVRVRVRRGRKVGGKKQDNAKMEAKEEEEEEVVCGVWCRMECGSE